MRFFFFPLWGWMGWEGVRGEVKCGGLKVK